MVGRRASFFASRGGIVAAGAAIGLVAALLRRAGNPPNMGICVACFERDIAGALGLHRAAPVQYIRPEIIGFVLGSLASAIAFGEFRARCGSAPILRFVLGILAMVGALAFLGCPWRALLRLAGGDLNALLGLAGLAGGIAAGVGFLKAGYSLGRSARARPAVGLVLPILAAGLLLLRIFSPSFGEGGPIFSSASGPGSLHAPLVVSLGAGLAIGFLAQRTRFCTMGAVRDLILMRDAHLASGAAALLAAAFAANLAFGQVAVGYAGQPVAHSSPLWNVLGMALSGLAFTLAGGCPGRQLVLAGEGDGDAAVFVLGMVAGAALSHNFALAGIPDKVADGAVVAGGLTAAGQAAVLGGLVFSIAIGFAMREKG